MRFFTKLERISSQRFRLISVSAVVGLLIVLGLIISFNRDTVIMKGSEIVTTLEVTQHSTTTILTSLNAFYPNIESRMTLNTMQLYENLEDVHYAYYPELVDYSDIILTGEVKSLDIHDNFIINRITQGVEPSDIDFSERRQCKPFRTYMYNIEVETTLKGINHDYISLGRPPPRQMKQRGPRKWYTVGYNEGIHLSELEIGQRVLVFASHVANAAETERIQPVYWYLGDNAIMDIDSFDRAFPRLPNHFDNRLTIYQPLYTTGCLRHEDGSDQNYGLPPHPRRNIQPDIYKDINLRLNNIDDPSGHYYELDYVVSAILNRLDSE